MSSLFKARAESAAKVISMQNEINFLKKQLAESDTSALKKELLELKAQLELSCASCQEKDLQIAELTSQLQDSSSNEATSSSKKRGRKSKSTSEES